MKPDLSTKLVWLHLSDWHQSGSDFDREVVGKRLLQDIAERHLISPDLAAVDLIVFSGDVAHRGQPEEYAAAARNLFDPLLAATAVPKDRLFFVAGNHDLDWGQFYLLPPALNKPFASSDEVNHWWTDPRRRARLLEPFEPFGVFTTGYSGREQTAAYGTLLQAAGRQIGVLGINSALMSGRQRDPQGQINDYGALVVGEPQMQEALAATAGADLRLAILHHPFQWLAEFDRARVRETLGRECHFVLCGHQHSAEANVVKGTVGDCIIVPTGASYDRRQPEDARYNNGYNLTCVDFGSGKAVIYLRRWSERQGRWVADTDATDLGRLELPLPKQDAAPPAAPPRAAARPRRQHQPATWRNKELLLVPAGPFLMGTTEEQARELSDMDRLHPFDNECPQHELYLDSYLISRFPVTNQEYLAFVQETGWRVPFRDDDWSRPMNWDPERRTFPAGKADHPVVLVSWYDAMEYCRWFGARLPTEAEWEKAARGTDGRKWPWGDYWQANRCNADGSIYAGTRPVGSYGVRGESPYGVADMAGNVWEWCSSHPDPYPYDPEDGREDDSPAPRAQRGGAWEVRRIYARCALRASRSPEDFGFNVGFRLALDPQR